MQRFGVLVCLLFFGVLVETAAFATQQGASVLMKESFSISIPESWIEIPKEILEDTFERAVKVLGDNAVKNDYGFVKLDAATWHDLPYIMVQIRNIGPVSEQELERISKINLKKELHWTEKESQKTIEFPKGESDLLYDEENKILWMRIDDHVEGVGVIAGLSGMILNENGFIQVTGCCYEQEYPKYESIFRSVILSVDRAPVDARRGVIAKAPTKQTVKERSSTQVKSRKAPRGSKAISRLISGAIALLVFTLLGSLFRKK